MDCVPFFRRSASGNVEYFRSILLQKVRQAFHRVRHLRVYMDTGSPNWSAVRRVSADPRPELRAHCKDHRRH